MQGLDSFEAPRAMTSDVYEWPKSSLGKRLKTVEESLVCMICSDFYSNPHSLFCGHTFCSLCIRTHFDRKLNSVSFDQCPVCREKCDVSQLRCNRSLAAAVDGFKAVREDLLSQCCNNLDVTNNKTSQKVTNSMLDERNNPGDVLDVRRLVLKSFHKLSRDKVKKELETLCKGSAGRNAL